MAVRIRLKRVGRTHRPCYRIEVFDSKTRRDGRSIETVGTYDPLESDDQKQVTLSQERIEYWLSVGAQPSDTVASFLRRRGIRWGKPAGKKRKRGTAGKKKAAATK